MGEFEVGDKVRILNSAYSPLRVGDLHVIHGGTTGDYRIKDTLRGTTWYFHEKALELVEKRMKKYKIETELSLQQVYQLHCLTGQLNNMTDVWNETGVLCEQELGLDFEFVSYDGEDHITFQEECGEIAKKGKRKVVKVGDKEYYEDELQTALANIKPINL